MWTTETPTRQGIYYFRDKHAAKKPGHAAWVARVDPVRDEKRGLYADLFYGVYDHLDIDAPIPQSLSQDMVAPLGKAGIILRSHPTLSHSSVTEWAGEWWGPMAPGVYQLRDEYAAQEAGMTVWWAIIAAVRAIDEAARVEGGGGYGAISNALWLAQFCRDTLEKHSLRR